MDAVRAGKSECRLDADGGGGRQSPTVATTTRNSGRSQSGQRTLGSCGRRESISLPSESSPGLASSPSRATTTLTGLIVSSICFTRHGVAVDLATATASPPPWLSARHPESLPILVDGARLWPGGRQHYCPHSVEYRSAALSLVGQLADRYASHPGLALWHVNNEYGGMPACYCDVSAAAFRNWLQQRYGQLDALNDAWGTSFWSQAYADWEEINPPRRTPAFATPSQ